MWFREVRLAAYVTGHFLEATSSILTSDVIQLSSWHSTLSQETNHKGFGDPNKIFIWYPSLNKLLQTSRILNFPNKNSKETNSSKKIISINLHSKVFRNFHQFAFIKHIPNCLNWAAHTRASRPLQKNCNMRFSYADNIFWIFSTEKN